MAHLRSRRVRARAVPAGLMLIASLGLLPHAATAAAQEPPATPAAGDTAAGSAAGGPLSYVVNATPGKDSVDRVEQAVTGAGGKVIAAHDQIGVIVAHSSNPRFAETLRTVDGVQSAGATRTAPLKSAGTTDIGKPQKTELTDAARTAGVSARKAGEEPLESLQWDLSAIKADEAAKVNPGSHDVTVAVIDTGVDDTHPDLKPNFSTKQSANCVGGVPDTSPGAWRPYDPQNDYHGTHVAGSVAAARNGVGVAGVAPGVKVSSIKVSEQDTSLFFAESVVCAFVFAADHGVEVTNNSYYVDPWMFNCKDDPDQGAIVDAVGRAARYAERKGAINVAAAGNSNFDLAADSLADKSSPNDSTPVERTVDPAECWDVPTQLPGTVTVAATGVKKLKSYYSNYGLDQIDVAAPGGDRDQVPELPAKSGNILSTMPQGDYAYLAGTSMASPHVAGVAALIKSAHPQAGPQEIQWLLKAQADNPGCPEGDPTCTGTPHINAHFGYGIVDALDAVED